MARTPIAHTYHTLFQHPISRLLFLGSTLCDIAIAPSFASCPTQSFVLSDLVAPMSCVRCRVPHSRMTTAHGPQKPNRRSLRRLAVARYLSPIAAVPLPRRPSCPPPYGSMDECPSPVVLSAREISRLNMHSLGVVISGGCPGSLRPPTSRCRATFEPSLTTRQSPTGFPNAYSIHLSNPLNKPVRNPRLDDPRFELSFARPLANDGPLQCLHHVVNRVHKEVVNSAERPLRIPKESPIAHPLGVNTLIVGPIHPPQCLHLEFTLDPLVIISSPSHRYPPPTSQATKCLVPCHNLRWRMADIS